MRDRKKIAVLFENLGPYHVARLNAMPTELEVVSIERREKSIEYQWTNELRPKCRNHQLFLANETDCGWKNLRKRLLTCLVNEQPDYLLLNGWSDPMTFAALSWSLKEKRPAMIMSDSSVHDKPRNRLKEAFKRKLLLLFDGYLAAGTTHVEYLRLLGVTQNRIAVGFDAVDNGYYEAQATMARNSIDSVRSELDLPSRFLLVSARFVEKKNLIRLLEAYAMYVRRTRESKLSPEHLVILGDGPLRPKIESSIQSFAIESFVHLKGFQQYDVLPKYYALATGLVLASTEEQWGLVVNEAMASSLPIAISNRCGCASDLVRAGANGFTFDPFEIASISTAIESLAKLTEQQRISFGIESKKIISQWGLNRFHDGVQYLINEVPPRKCFTSYVLRSIASIATKTF